MTTSLPDLARLRATAAAMADCAPGDTRLVRVPYRICPLGAHVDHQLGLVTGLALERALWLAYAPVAEARVRLRSRELPGEVAFALDQPEAQRGEAWGRYARGAAAALVASGYELQRGICGMLAGTLPIGGLSSSAAVTIAYLLALEEANGLEVGERENVALEQHVENRFIGLNNGILDQSVILLSRRGQLLFLDCESDEHWLVPAPPAMPPFQVVVAYSGVTEALVGTDYNQRVAECQEAARLLLAYAGLPIPEPPRLRHVPREAYEEYVGELPEALARRAAHFFSENARVLDGVRAWEVGELEQFGAAMFASGESSIRNYECGSPELTTLFEALREAPGVYGARFSGAGFRGSCMALADPEARPEIVARLADTYPREHPKYANTYEVLFCDTDDGARFVEE